MVEQLLCCMYKYLHDFLIQNNMILFVMEKKRIVQ